jgi:CDGSH-type Zn-finger protein
VSKEEVVTARTEISVVDGGPLVVRGPVLVTDAEGDEFPLRHKTVMLCRYGASRNKPFCDGSHAKIGFRAFERAAWVDDGANAPAEIIELRAGGHGTRPLLASRTSC